MRGRKPKPTAIRRLDGNPGKRPFNATEPIPPDSMPTCPPHLSDEAVDEWDRLGPVLHAMGVVTMADRAALAAYCQAYGRWVEAEERLRETPLLLKTPSGYVQQSPWLSVSNKQLELMGRFMVELGLTPASRSRLALPDLNDAKPVAKIEIVIVSTDEDGNRVERPLNDPTPIRRINEELSQDRATITLDERI